MKILMLNNEYPPLGGGQANANYYLYKEFKKYPDLQIDIITASTDKYKDEKSKLGTIYFLDIGKKEKNLHFQSSKELIAWSLKTLRFGKNLLKKEKYDLVVAWSGVPAGYLAYRLNKKFNVPYIILLRGTDVPFWEEKWEYLDKFIFSWLSPKIWKNAKEVIANSEKLKDKANKLSPNQKIIVIPNGVDTAFFKPVNKIENGNIILYVGRLSKIKNLDKLVISLSGLKKENFRLWLVGDGPERENLENIARENGIHNKVNFLGIKNKTDLLKIYQKSSIFCLPSKNEGMSNSLLEAMACGLPIIATDVGGTKELIRRNGFIIRTTESEELKDKIDLLINNKNLRIKMGKESRKIAEKMSWKEVAKKFILEIKK